MAAPPTTTLSDDSVSSQRPGVTSSAPKPGANASVDEPSLNQKASGLSKRAQRTVTAVKGADKKMQRQVDGERIKKGEQRKDKATDDKKSTAADISNEGSVFALIFYLLFVLISKGRKKVQQKLKENKAIREAQKKLDQRNAGQRREHIGALQKDQQQMINMHTELSDHLGEMDKSIDQAERVIEEQGGVDQLSEEDRKAYESMVAEREETVQTLQQLDESIVKNAQTLDNEQRELAELEGREYKSPIDYKPPQKEEVDEQREASEALNEQPEFDDVDTENVEMQQMQTREQQQQHEEHREELREGERDGLREELDGDLEDTQERGVTRDLSHDAQQELDNGTFKDPLGAGTWQNTPKPTGGGTTADEEATQEAVKKVGHGL